MREFLDVAQKKIKTAQVGQCIDKENNIKFGFPGKIALAIKRSNIKRIFLLLTRIKVKMKLRMIFQKPV